MHLHSANRQLSCNWPAISIQKESKQVHLCISQTDWKETFFQHVSQTLLTWGCRAFMVSRLCSKVWLGWGKRHLKPVVQPLTKTRQAKVTSIERRKTVFVIFFKIRRTLLKPLFSYIVRFSITSSSCCSTTSYFEFPFYFHFLLLTALHYFPRVRQRLLESVEHSHSGIWHELPKSKSFYHFGDGDVNKKEELERNLLTKILKMHEQHLTISLSMRNCNSVKVDIEFRW